MIKRLIELEQNQKNVHLRNKLPVDLDIIETSEDTEIALEHAARIGDVERFKRLVKDHGDKINDTVIVGASLSCFECSTAVLHLVKEMDVSKLSEIEWYSSTKVPAIASLARLIRDKLVDRNAMNVMLMQTIDHGYFRRWAVVIYMAF